MGLWAQARWWYRLAHVCQRWRNLILGSASYLRLTLYCTNGTPVQDMLLHSPPLPLTVDYHSEGGITVEDEEGILLALEQRHRVRHLHLVFAVQNMQKFVTEIDKEFQILEYLIVFTSPRSNTALVIPETFQAPRLHHLMLEGFACPIRSPFHPTAVGLVTLFLTINRLSAYFQPNILLERISSIPQLARFAIAFTFPVPSSDVERQLTHTPITAPITLPNLRLFSFQGISVYLEAIICRITTPRLENLQIQFFMQLTFSVPRLVQFINTTENLRFDSAEIEFSNKRARLETYVRETNALAFAIKVYCVHLDWQVASAAQFSNALSQVFAAVEHLTLQHEVHTNQSSEEHDDFDRVEWRNLLRPFNNVKTLGVEDRLVEELSRCLQLGGGELPLELLPELQELQCFGISDNSTGDAFTSFIDSRNNAGRPVNLVCHNQSPSPSESFKLETPAIITSADGEANDDLDT